MKYVLCGCRRCKYWKWDDLDGCCNVADKERPIVDGSGRCITYRIKTKSRRRKKKGGDNDDRKRGNAEY